MICVTRRLAGNPELKVRVPVVAPPSTTRPLLHLKLWKLDGSPTLRTLVYSVAREALKDFRIRARFSTPALQRRLGYPSVSVLPQDLFEILLGVFTDVRSVEDLRYHLSGRWALIKVLLLPLYSVFATLNPLFAAHQQVYAEAEKRRTLRSKKVFSRGAPERGRCDRG